MSAVSGGRVKEPRIIRRSVLPVNKRTSSAADLAQAWTTFGEAKEVLQRLESSVGSSPVRYADPSLKNHRRVRPPSHVQFDPGVERAVQDGSRRPTDFHRGVRVGTGAESRGGTQKFHDVSVGESEKENIVEGAVLNDTQALSPPTSTSATRSQDDIRPGLRDTAALSTGASPRMVHAVEPGIVTRGLPTLAPPVSQAASLPLSWSPASNPNTVTVSQPTRTAHTNTRAVFAPAVNFGDRPSTSGAVLKPVPARYEPPRPASERTLSSRRTTHPTPAPHPPPLHQRAPVSTARVPAPLRKLELPSDTLSTLRAKIEQQKQAVQATAARMDSLRAPPTSTVAFFPLPEASTATSSFASSSSTSHPHTHPYPVPPRDPPTHQQPYVLRHQEHEMGRKVDPSNPVKRRKVVVAPPPPTYSGFSSSDVRTRAQNKPPSSSHASHRVQWRANLERVGVGKSDTAGGPEGRVRKIHRITATADAGSVRPTQPSGPPRPSRPGLITPSSWRAGKELADRILKQSSVVPTSHHAPPSRDSESLSREHSEVSSTVSLGGEDDAREERGSPQPGVQRMRPVGGGEEEGRVRGTLPTTAARLLEELESLSQAEEEEESHPVSSRPKRYIPDSTASAPKKPRFNFEPVYPSEKTRHYDQSEVQKYMRQKQDERRHRAHDEKLALERARRERDERLQELHHRQKETLAANQRLRQREREAYSMALASAPVHIHIHDTTSSDSEPLTGEVRRPLLTVSPVPPPHLPSPYSQSTPQPVVRDQHTSLSPHTHPTPPTHSPLSRPIAELSPPRYSSLGSSNPPASPYTREQPILTTQSHSPTSISPRTYSIPRSSPSLTPSPRGAHISPPTSTHAQFASPRAQIRLSPPPPLSSLLTPSPRGAHISPPTSTHAQFASPRAQTRLSPPPPSGDLTSLLRGVTHSQPKDVSPTSGMYRKREERIQALTQSALRLKQRIAQETKKLTEGGHSPHKSRTETTSPRSSGVPRPHPGPVEKETLRERDLPGVHNIHRHALEAERARQEAEAALKIQAAYRGYQVRQSLQWRLPSGLTMGSVLRGGRGAGGDGREEVVPVPVAQPSVSHPECVTKASSREHETQPLGMSQSCPLLSTTPPLPLPPWQQTGGDSHSVINVFTRQHERLKETLAHLKSQKLTELRHLREPTVEAGEGDTGTKTPPRSTLSMQHNTHTGPSSYSYSQTFEASSSGQRSDDEESSQVSAQFSQDSLVATESTTGPSPATKSREQVPSVTLTHETRQASESRSPSLYSESHISPPQPRSTSREVSAITPPGSPSFVETFSHHRPMPQPSHERKAEMVEPQTGRLSPRSLELKLQAELNLLASVEESMQQLTNMERTRAVSLAQQETVSLAQLLKSRQLSHEQELQSLAGRAKREVEEAHQQFQKVHHEATLASQQLRKMQGEADIQAKEHTKRLAQLQEESAQTAREASRQLAEARTSATQAVIEAAQQQMQAAHSMAMSVASTAAQQAVKAAVKSKLKEEASESTEPSRSASVQRSGGWPERPHTELPVEEDGYQSDFEPSTMQADSLGGSSTATITEEEGEEGQRTPRQPAAGTQEGSLDESLTPVPSEVQTLEGEGDQTLVEGEEEKERESSSRTPSPVEEIDVDEVSFRELLPSESHRRHLSHLSSDSESPSSSRPRTPSSAPLPTSAGGGGGGVHSAFTTEDSFFQFMSRMVQQYMCEEELRARHQATLLQLRERALQEKTEAELEWLGMKKKQLRSKGADDLMPPLVNRERGLLKKLQHEQAEIRQLKEAQQVASCERRLMLQQQKEISKIRRSAQYYRKKIRRYSSHPRHDGPFSPTPEREFSPAPSLNDSQQGLEESLRLTPEPPAEGEEPEPPQEHISHSTPTHTPSSFPTYSPSRTPHTPGTLPEEVGSREVATAVTGSLDLTAATGTPRTEMSRSAPVLSAAEGSSRLLAATPKSVSTDSVTAKKLKKMASTDAERYLTQHERRLLKRRRQAEAALQQQQELLRREEQLACEEEHISQLIDRAMECYQHRRTVHREGGKPTAILETTPTPRETPPKSQNVQATPAEASISVESSSWSAGGRPHTHTPSPSSVSEQIQTSASIAEEIPEETTPRSQREADKTRTVPSTSRIPTEYADDTFEVTPSHSHPTTSTPAQQKAPSASDFSLSESLKSFSESVGTTSEGSSIETRIRQLRETLRQRKEEVRRVQSEQKRRRKAVLRQQEEQLRRKLQAVEHVISRAQHSPSVTPHPPSSPSTTPTSVASQPESEGQPSPLPSSPPHTPTPQPIAPPPDHTNTSEAPPSEQSDTLTRSESAPSEHIETSLPPGAQPEETVPIESAATVVEALVPSSVQEYSYTGFSEGGEVDVTVLSEGERLMAKEITPEISPSPEIPVEEGREEEDAKQASPISSISEQLSQGSESGPEEHIPVEPSYSETFKKSAASPVPSEGVEPREPSYSETFEQPSELSEVATGAKEESPAMEAPEEMDLQRPFSAEDTTPGFQTGQRVLIGSVMAGTVRFVGPTQFAEGVWIGVELDLPKGRNDGSIDGHSYFSCEPKHGLFAPPSKVSLFEEESLEDSSVPEEVESALSSMHERETTEPPMVQEDFTKQFHVAPSMEHDTEGNLSEDHAPTEVKPADAMPASDVQVTVPCEDRPVSPQEAIEEVPSHLHPFPLPSLAPTPAPLPESTLKLETREPPIATTAEKLHVDREASVERISSELVQELSNEAFETMQRILRAKQPPQTQQVSEVVVLKDKEVPLTLEQKAERVTDELLALLLQSETNLMCNIQSAKKTQSPPSSPKAVKPKSSKSSRDRSPPTHLTIPIFNGESSPPPVSPPSSSSPYRGSPPPGEFSPPSSPPRHLSGASAARVAAGEKTPVFTGQHQESSPSRKASVSPVMLERTGSMESITELLESVKLTTAQCLVPSDRACVNEVTTYAWNSVQNAGIDNLHSTFECPPFVKLLFADDREMSKEEDQCRKAYLELVYNLAIETIRELHPTERPRPVWALQGAVGTLLAPRHQKEEVTLELVQRKVYGRLMSGQLPLQLPTVKFLYGLKRPGGREVDFVDALLIRELRREEPTWVDYSEDDAQVKMRTADAILDCLLSETVQILNNIQQKRKRH